MNKQSFLFYSLISIGLLFLVVSCDKEITEPEISIDPDAIVFPEPSEEIINGELFIDGISQKEQIVDFDIEGVSYIEGRLAFVDQDAYINARRIISKHNSESVLAWSNKMGIQSIFTQYMELEAKPLDEVEVLVKEEQYRQFFTISEYGFLDYQTVSALSARLYNTKGIFQVGDFVGTILPGLNVWVEKDKVAKLEEALSNRYIPQTDRDFLVVDQSAFDLGRNWTVNESCPKLATWNGPSYQYKNPTANRRIDVENSWEVMIIPAGGGLWNSDFEYTLHTTSRKSSCCRYKTNHYLSLDLRTQWFNNGNPTGSITTVNISNTGTNTKEAWYSATYDGLRNVTSSIASNEIIGLVETLPGTSGLSGTAGSHRGMGARYGRQDCD